MTVAALPVLPKAHTIPEGVLAMRPRALWAALRSQPLSVWLVYIFVFLEYVRPQSIYPALGILPFSQITLLLAAGLALTQEHGKRRWTVIDTGMLAYSIIVALSLAFAFDPKYGFDKINIYGSWIAVYYVISTTLNTQTRVVLLMLTYFLWNLKMTQHGVRGWAQTGFGFRDWGVTGAPGWFQNSGEFGIQMCVLFPVAIYFALGVRPYISKFVFFLFLGFAGTAVASAIASSSRGALVGLAGVALWMLARGKYKVRGTIALLVLGGATYALIPNEQRDRLSASGDDSTSQSRLRYWTRGIEFANDHPFIGIGYANWMPYYTKVWGAKLEDREIIQLPHNFMIEALAELGYTGLFALLFLIFGTFWLNAKTRALARKLGDEGRLSWHLATGLDGALIGYMISGSFVTVLYYPYLWVNLAMTVAVHRSVMRAVVAARGARK